jgi:hypothetical protein
VQFACCEARAIKRIFFKVARRRHSPAALQFRGIGTPRWQLNQTLIPGNALPYYYVNPVGLCAAQHKAWPSSSDGERQEKSAVAQTSLPYWR